MQEMRAGLSNYMHFSERACLCLSLPPCLRLHTEISNYFAIKLLFCITMASVRLSNHILMRGWIVEEKLFLFLFILSVRRSSSAPCSPSGDKQLTFGMTRSTLISTKYSTVPLFEAVNLISEGISHLAIIFWTIKPISEE